MAASPDLVPSSSRSGGQSPSSPPNHAHAQRKPVATGSILNAGMGAPNGLKVLSSGWQVWGNSAPGVRNVSTSSSASGPDPTATQTEPYRSSLGDAWASRSASGTWDEVADNSQQDSSQMESHSALPLHSSRQRHSVHAALGVAAGSAPKRGQYSPQRFSSGGLTRESTAPSRYPSSSSTRSPYGMPTPLVHGEGQGESYRSFETTSSFVEDDLSLAFRGMVAADDSSPSQPQAQQTSVPLASSLGGQFGQHPSPHQLRAPPQLQQARAPYSGFPQADYSAYYGGPSAPVDYQYSYDAYRQTSETLYAPSPALTAATGPNVYAGLTPQSLHPHAVPDVHSHQAGIFFDYTGSPRPMASQFYYAAQPMVYHASATLSPMLDKKRDIHYTQQQLGPHGMMYANVRSTPSPHPQVYHGHADLRPGVMVPAGTVYGPPGMNPHPQMHQFQHGGRGGRRGNVAADHRVSIRSPLLDEFRANKNRKWELQDIYGYIVEFSGDQHGSRFIQQKVETASSEEKQKIFEEIVPVHALQLIQDVFGNYVVQKLFEHGTQTQRALLAETMEGHILPLSLQMYGCRVVQKAVEFVTPEQQSSFVQELESQVLRCVRDANGNHVIQKLIECVAAERLTFVGSFKGYVYELATHPYGCRVLQRCFEHLHEDHIRPLMDELHKHVTQLMQDQFGNYVVQFVLEHGNLHDRAIVVSKLRGQMLHMARHKFASNVCEKALITADTENRRLLIEEMMAPRPDGLSPVLAMMKDQYANYVLQRALTVVEGEQKQALIASIRPQLMNMRRYSSTFSKHLTSIERLLEKCVSDEEKAQKEENDKDSQATAISSSSK